MNSKVPVSQCRLWSDLQLFYQEQGIDVWQKDVPFYATSNAYIAHAYARTIWQFIEEGKFTATKDKPVYIIEIGAGSGAFAFYCIKRLLELQTALNLEHISFTYVMTDYAQKNVDFWLQHPELRKYVAYGCLDFARHDILADDRLVLIHKNEEIPKSKTPWIVLANYLFDSLPHDVFRMTGGRLQECLMEKEPRRPLCSDNQCISLELVDPDLKYRDIIMPYYGNNELDDLLKDYATYYGDGYFLLPVGTLRYLQKLRLLTDSNFMLIVSDKAYGRHARLFAENKPDIVFHRGAVSMSVNYEAIGYYIGKHGGDSHFQSTQQTLSTAVFTMGRRFVDLPKTNYTLMHELSASGPGNLLQCYQHILHSHTECSLETLVSYLNLTYWDPHFFDICINSILKHLQEKSDASVALGLVEHLPLLLANFYYRPGTIDTLTNIALVYQQVGLYQNALDHYELSIGYFGEQAPTFYNMGLCHYYLGHKLQAKQLFKAALGVDYRYIMARGWIAQIDTEAQLPNTEMMDSTNVTLSRTGN